MYSQMTNTNFFAYCFAWGACYGHLPESAVRQYSKACEAGIVFC